MDRARCIYELATQQVQLDIPEKLWKAYIEFETELGEFQKVRDIYHRILDRTHHIKVLGCWWVLGVDGVFGCCWVLGVGGAL